MGIIDLWRLIDRIREAETLMEAINNNPLHPVNDARHPEHAISVQAYQALADWCQGQRDRHEDALRAWQKTYF